MIGNDRDRITGGWSMNVWNEMAGLLDRYDGSVRFDCRSESAWSGALRLTLTNPLNSPSRSIVFYTVAAANPARAARTLLDAADEWMSASGVEPLPVPAKMRPEE
jgi:hypothetical protein